MLKRSSDAKYCILFSLFFLQLFLRPFILRTPWEWGGCHLLQGVHILRTFEHRIIIQHPNALPNPNCQIVSPRLLADPLIKLVRLLPDRNQTPKDSGLQERGSVISYQVPISGVWGWGGLPSRAHLSDEKDFQKKLSCVYVGAWGANESVGKGSCYQF